ncbi:uncharacterized protein SCHCODRAFT_02640426, partial [Schizophyllum commune H4-8]|uniref:uncharacterized protein n=1 Tax=Schizophyllum commune (strain H4-8 / FGSC 9210) TaxID=578458 RepID=UPI00215E426D
MVYAPLATFGPPLLGDHTLRYTRAPEMPESPDTAVARSMTARRTREGACVRRLSGRGLMNNLGILQCLHAHWQPCM